MATFTNLPGVRVTKNDGNLLPAPASRAPRVCVIGTSGRGQGEAAYLVTSPSAARSEFGNDGTLIRGMQETLKAGAKEVLLYRIGATSCLVEHIGDSAGVTGWQIQTVEQDEDSGTSYAAYYDDSEDRLVVKRNSDDLVVYDNNPDNPIDLFEVEVSGYRASGGGVDIGSPSSYVNLADIKAPGYTGCAYTAGTDGLSLSRMEVFEKLYVAYKNLLQEDFDVCVPMDVYLDDFNVIDDGKFISSIGGSVSGVLPVVPGAQTYPTAGAFAPGSDVDSLGMVYVEQYLGEFYFWWWFDDGSGTFSTANIYPSAGSASATTKTDGTALSEEDFHEVNFAFQLAKFLYDYSSDVVDATGVIGVRPPASHNNLADKARWIGKAPTWTMDTNTGAYTVASSDDDGYGMLGSKFMVGKSDWRSGVFGGGFILTDNEFMDGEEQIDENDVEVDLGKYISVVADWPFMRNNYNRSGYISTFATSYAGMYVNMAANSAPTNKPVNSSLSIVTKISLQDIDSLVGAGYVVMRDKIRLGLVVADAPTATLPNSDWRRLSTVRIIKSVIDGVRAVCEPFIGEGTSSATRSSMATAVGEVLLQNKKLKYLQDYKPFEVEQTPQMEVEGQINIKLSLVPAFEIRFIDFTINVSRSGS